MEAVSKTQLLEPVDIIGQNRIWARDLLKDSARKQKTKGRCTNQCAGSHAALQLQGVGFRKNAVPTEGDVVVAAAVFFAANEGGGCQLYLFKCYKLSV